MWGSIKAMFGGALPWVEKTADPYFKEDILRVTSEPWVFGEFVWPTVIGLALTWIAIYFSIAKGVLRVGKIVMITVPLPLLILAALVVRGVTLDGAADGLAYYLAPDWAKLAEPKTWLAAYGQVFFSLSVGWGILIAYASYMSRKTDVTNNALITSFANCGFSFMAGFAVFSTVGYLGVATSTPVGDIKATSFSLAFATYPTAIENMPGGAVMQALIAVGFFLMLLTLGVDSAFSIVEAVSTSMYDKFRMKRETLVKMLCFGGFIMGLIFCFGSGLYWLDITDHFMNDYGLGLIALVQAVLIGWLIPRDEFKRIMDNINERSEIRIGKPWAFSLRVITPLVLGTAIVLSTHTLITEGYEGYPAAALLVSGVLPVAAIIMTAYLLQSMKGKGDEDDE